MKYTRLVIMVILGALFCAAYLSGLMSYITLAHLKQCSHLLVCYTQAHCVQSVLVFCLVCFVALVLSWPWAALFSIAAGYLFGLVSIFFVVPIFTLGAVGAFLIARYILGDYVQHHWGTYLRAFNAEIACYGGWYLLVVRMVPFIPFFLVNSLAALTPISLRSFTFATLFGIIPPTLIFVIAGTQLAVINTIADILSWRVLGALGVLILLVVVPLIYQRFFVRRA